MKKKDMYISILIRIAFLFSENNINAIIAIFLIRPSHDIHLLAEGSDTFDY